MTRLNWSTLQSLVTPSVTINGFEIPDSARIRLGSQSFCDSYDLAFPLMMGGMATGIASVEAAIAMAEAGFLGVFGAAGMTLDRVRSAVERLMQSPASHRIAVNFIHRPDHPDAEVQLANLLTEMGVSIIEASAFMYPTKGLVAYRAKGLVLAGDGVRSNHRIIVKLSRPEVAEKLMAPAPQKVINQLLADGLITAAQAELVSQLPLVDDVTVEADSGGHTDKQALVTMLPIICQRRDESGFPIRVGAAGGIATPVSVLAALELGADYVVTGSINQCTREAGTSDAVKGLLANAKSTDVAQGPAADMFELGAKVQVLKGKTLFAVRAQKLLDWYQTYDGIHALPDEVIQKLESQYFKATVDEIWQSCVTFFTQHNPKELAVAQSNPKKKMAILFRYYLGLSSQWAVKGVADRVSDYQIWCGQAMGGFNEWVKGSDLEMWENRSIAGVNQALVMGTLKLKYIQMSRTVTGLTRAA